MRYWKPAPGVGIWIGVLFLIVTLGAAGWLLVQLASIFRQPPEQWQVDLTVFGYLVALVGLLLLIGWLGYRLAAALTLSYAMDRNGLYIIWIGEPGCCTHHPD
ncbi:MAG: hypothetical protein HC893_09145 [Chloroflexaceae bacterium]|nr:hypothetical protein [Chloroflexaceae bacterium]